MGSGAIIGEGRSRTASASTPMILGMRDDRCPEQAMTRVILSNLSLFTAKSPTNKNAQPFGTAEPQGRWMRLSTLSRVTQPAEERADLDT